jgi:hypothetical protein
MEHADAPPEECPATLALPVAIATPMARAVDHPSDAEATDNQFLALWLHGRSPLTIRAYRREASRFRCFIAKPLRLVTLGDFQAFADTFDGAPGTRARVIATIKSLLSFAVKLAALRFNVGTALRPPPIAKPSPTVSSPKLTSPACSPSPKAAIMPSSDSPAPEASA